MPFSWSQTKGTASDVEVVVLGITQDAGFPQADCQKACCANLLKEQVQDHHVSCLGVIDHRSRQMWLLDATPDFTHQLHTLQSFSRSAIPYDLAGIIITHAHIGHYTGLMYLGREAMDAQNVNVFCLPRMKTFLESNGPWSQLVTLGNIQLFPIQAEATIQLTEQVALSTILVPHRDEFSETAGIVVSSKSGKALFIPDIDKWEKWDRDINDFIRDVDMAFLDGTFYENGELPNRDMSEIPHPFVEESMSLFQDLSDIERKKIHFIHLNHTNPLLDPNSEASEKVLKKGYKVAREGMILGL